MYRKLTEKEIKYLHRKDVENGFLVVSHVGDGEYPCNVFGNIYTSFWQAWKNIQSESRGAVVSMYIDTEGGEVFLCYGTAESYDSYLRMPKIARFTLEKVNDGFYFGN
jgi:hypothetical protein